MRHKSGSDGSAEKTVKDIRRATRKHNPYLLFRRIAFARFAPNVFDGAVCSALMAFGLLPHHSLLNGDDEPKTLPYANLSFCPMSADAGQRF